MIKRLWIAIQDYWVAIGIFVGIAFSVYNLLSKFTSWGLVTANWVMPIGVGLFFVSGIFAIIRYRNKERDLEPNKVDVGKINAESKHQTGGQNIAAQTVNIYGQDNIKKNDLSPMANFNETVRLMNLAIHDANDFARTAEYELEPSRKKKYITAYSSWKTFRDYFDDHMLYYSANARKLQLKLVYLIAASIRRIWEASSKGNEKWRLELYDNLAKESHALQEEIINEFQKSLKQ